MGGRGVLNKVLAKVLNKVLIRYEFIQVPVLVKDPVPMSRSPPPKTKHSIYPRTHWSYPVRFARAAAFALEEFHSHFMAQGRMIFPSL